MNPFSLGGDIENKVFFSLRSCRWSMEKGVVTKRPCHEAQGDLLSVHPVRSGVRWVVFCPIFDQSPEGFRVLLVVRCGIGTNEGVDKTKTVEFPDEFDIT